MATVKYYLDIRRMKKGDVYPLKLVIRHNDKFMLSTSFSSKESNWTGFEFTSKEPNYKTKNVAIRNLINRVENILFNLEETGKLKGMTDKMLKGILESSVSSSQEKSQKVFIDYLEEFTNLKAKDGTKKVYVNTRNKLSQYDPQCTFESMDVSWLTLFDKNMEEDGLNTNARGIHMRNIRAIFNYAIDQDVTNLYPFRKFKIKKEETEKRSLDVEKLILLRDYSCEGHQERYRDMFMLMFYLIGINGVDLFSAKKGNVISGRFDYRRAKTGKLYSIKLEPEALTIIERYRGHDWLVNVKDTYANYMDFLHRMDIGLQQIGPFERKGLGGKKVREPILPDLTTYVARHNLFYYSLKISDLALRQPMAGNG